MKKVKRDYKDYFKSQFVDIKMSMLFKGVSGSIIEGKKVS